MKGYIYLLTRRSTSSLDTGRIRWFFGRHAYTNSGLTFESHSWISQNYTFSAVDALESSIMGTTIIDTNIKKLNFFLSMKGKDPPYPQLML